MIGVMVIAENRKLTKSVCDVLSQHSNVKINITHFSINTFNDLNIFNPKIVILDAYTMSSSEYIIRDILNFNPLINIFVINGRSNEVLSKNVKNISIDRLSLIENMIHGYKGEVKDGLTSKLVINNYAVEYLPLFLELLNYAVNDNVSMMDEVVRNKFLNKKVDFEKLVSFKVNYLDDFIVEFLDINKSNSISYLFDNNLDNIKSWFSNVAESVKSKKYSSLTRDSLSYILTEYKSNLSLDKLSLKLNVSKCYLSRIIKSDTNKTFLDKLNLLKMFIACQYLIHTDKNINTISHRVGFSDSLYFSRQFKKYSDLSPKNYRSFMREKHEGIS